MMRYNADGSTDLDCRKGYYFNYFNVSNFLGGYHPVNLTLKNDEKGICEQITDAQGRFLHFPGVVDGAWQKHVSGPFLEEMRFAFEWGFPKKDSDLLEFVWTYQPDGRYYGDDDGFGMEHDVEIVLAAGMDGQGRFTERFHVR